MADSTLKQVTWINAKDYGEGLNRVYGLIWNRTRWVHYIAKPRGSCLLVSFYFFCFHSSIFLFFTSFRFIHYITLHYSIKPHAYPNKSKKQYHSLIMTRLEILWLEKKRCFFDYSRETLKDCFQSDEPQKKDKHSCRNLQYWCRHSTITCSTLLLFQWATVTRPKLIRTQWHTQTGKEWSKSKDIQ